MHMHQTLSLRAGDAIHPVLCVACETIGCSHVAAIMFKIESAVRNGYTRLDIQQSLLAYAAGIRYFIESFVDTIMYN